MEELLRYGVSDFGRVNAGGPGGFGKGMRGQRREAVSTCDRRRRKGEREGSRPASAVQIALAVEILDHPVRADQRSKDPTTDGTGTDVGRAEAVDLHRVGRPARRQMNVETDGLRGTDTLNV